eukprot:TRINITY_DN23704_c0_g1_i2.p3 TRINITY_DN23704_c0_g1~~TRINITY_DN23704_c0_g1_i2.p3  ORF type:complete len:116 (+),score=29.76 TRINITY_DN23704_c0_g1_i2:139-486(+)
MPRLILTFRAAASLISCTLPTVNVIVDAAQLATKVSTLGMETAAVLEQIKGIVSVLKSKKVVAASFLSRFTRADQGHRFRAEVEEGGCCELFAGVAELRLCVEFPSCGPAPACFA